MKKGAIVLASVFLFSPALAAQEETVEMKVRRVVLDPSAQPPTAVVLLESVNGKRVLPIWIGNQEATSIAIELEKLAAPRPNSHDLIRNILTGVGITLGRVTITDLRNNVYYATISLTLKGQEYQIDSRPSDAIAVALRMKAPIYASNHVLAKAKQLPLLERQELRRTLGIQIQDLTPELASLLEIQVKRGVLVADVEIGGPAFQAGIQRGDVILKINGKAIQRASELESLLSAEKKPSQLRIEVLRKGKTTTVVLNLRP